jgi:hypothetical protein
MDAILRHVKEIPLLDEWFKGNTVVKFALGATSGMFVGSGLLRSDAGGTINLDPSKITGVYFENIIREEDAELAFKGIQEKNQDLQADVARLRKELQVQADGFAESFSDMESELALAGEREVELMKQLQPEQPTLEDSEGTEGFTDDTKKAAGIITEKVTITKDDVGELDVSGLGLDKK